MININFKLIKIFFYRIIFTVFLILTNSIISFNAFGSSKNFNTNSKIKYSELPLTRRMDTQEFQADVQPRNAREKSSFVG